MIGHTFKLVTHLSNDVSGCFCRITIKALLRFTEERIQDTTTVMGAYNRS